TLQHGVLYTFAQPQSVVPLDLPGFDGPGWWASRNWRQTVLAFDAVTGKPLWRKLGRRAPNLAQPGEMYYPIMTAGEVDGFVYVPDTVDQMWVWTKDGLFLGRLYHERWEGIFDANTVYIELLAGFVYKDNGKTYVMAGDHGVSVHEVTLPTLVPTQSFPVQV